MPLFTLFSQVQIYLVQPGADNENIRSGKAAVISTGPWLHVDASGSGSARVIQQRTVPYTKHCLGGTLHYFCPLSPLKSLGPFY